MGGYDSVFIIMGVGCGIYSVSLAYCIAVVVIGVRIAAFGKEPVVCIIGVGGDAA